jgi:hypothetical protein
VSFSFEIVGIGLKRGNFLTVSPYVESQAQAGQNTLENRKSEYELDRLVIVSVEIVRTVKWLSMDSSTTTSKRGEMARFSKIA